MDHSNYLPMVNYQFNSPCLIAKPIPFIFMPHTADKLFSPLLSPAFTYRRNQREGCNQALAKAVGLKSYRYPFILDATGGFGLDSCLLADLNCTVLILERHPLVAKLLQTTLPLLTPPPTQALFVLAKNSISYLANLSITPPDVIYLDPMFPPKKNSAQNKKNLRLLKELVGTDQDATQLFEVACKVAKRRVVVKRPRYAATITPKLPSYTLMGKSNRYDIYLTS